MLRRRLRHGPEESLDPPLLWLFSEHLAALLICSAQRQRLDFYNALRPQTLQSQCWLLTGWASGRFVRSPVQGVGHHRIEDARANVSCIAAREAKFAQARLQAADIAIPEQRVQRSGA